MSTKTLKNYIFSQSSSIRVITVTGILYNIGMIVGPWFEGRIAQGIGELISQKRTYQSLVLLAAAYVVSIAAVQTLRYVKRLYVRKYANAINREMKMDLYGCMIRMPQNELEKEGSGSLMTKAISDVDTCVEGIRKFTTEIFDTGVVMIAYLAMLFYYDWRLTLLAMIFPPIALIIADRMKKIIAKNSREYKERSGALSAATLDRVEHAATYRINGREHAVHMRYEEQLQGYEKTAVRANIWENALQPIYHAISMAGTLCILYFGARNILGTGWRTWEIASLITYLSCFTKLSNKTATSAKLFNSVQKAGVSWKRIKPHLVRMTDTDPDRFSKISDKTAAAETKDLSFSYPESPALFTHADTVIRRGQIVGLTGPVASGKSSFGKLFLGTMPFEGTLGVSGTVTYMGHEPELFSGSIAENILLGLDEDVWKWLKMVRLDEEVKQMPDGIDTRIGNGGVTLSGGQKARVALARSLCHRGDLLVLDDPFSAVDRTVETEIFENLKAECGDSAVLLISHRLAHFPECDSVIWLDQGQITQASHGELMEAVSEYAALFELQEGESNE